MVTSVGNTETVPWLSDLNASLVIAAYVLSVRRVAVKGDNSEKCCVNQSVQKDGTLETLALAAEWM